MRFCSDILTNNPKIVEEALTNIYGIFPFAGTENTFILDVELFTVIQYKGGGQYSINAR